MHKIEIGERAVARAMARRGRMRVWESIDPATTALIVVDLQNCFMAPGMPAEVPMAREIVPNVNRLGDALRKAGGHVVFLQNTFQPEVAESWSSWVDNFMKTEVRKGMFEQMARGSEGHALWPELDVRDEDAKIEKTRFSALVEGASDLKAHLDAKGIDTLLITGTVTNVCCESTARDAMMLNFKTIFIADGNAAITDEDHNATLTSLFQSFCDVQTTEEAIACFGGETAATLAAE